MYRVLLLSLTLLLISLCSIVIGLRNPLEQVIHEDFNQPKPSETQPLEEIYSDESSSKQEDSPRFILTPPKGEYSSLEPSLPTEPEISSHADIVSSLTESQAEVFAVDPEDLFPIEESSSESLEDVDPSAAAKEMQGQSIDSVPPKQATKDEINIAADPYLKEIFMIKSAAFERMDAIETELTDLFATVSTEEQSQELYAKGLEMIPEIGELVEQADTDVTNALDKMEAALAAIGVNDAEILSTAKRAYEAEKQEKVDYYTNLFLDVTTSQPVDTESGL